MIHDPSNGQSVVSPFGAVEGRILLVGGDASARRSLHGTLHKLGFDIWEATSGEEALAFSRITACDAALLARNTLGMGCIRTCRELRSLHPRTTILILGNVDDRERAIEALEAGADAYVVNPFHVRELVARLRPASHLSRTPTAQADQTIAVGEIEIHPARRLVRKSGEAIHLTPREFDLLLHLISHAGFPIAYSMLMQVVWRNELAASVRNLRTLMRKLRAKLETDASKPAYLLTDARVGYRFVDSSLVSVPRV